MKLDHKKFSSSRFADLETLVAVCNQGSFTGAAEVLGLTPSAVSKSISRLEQRIGVQLAQRTTRRVRMTEDGHELAANARRLLADLARLEERAMSEASLSGRITVAVSVPVGRRLLVPLLSEFQRLHPAVEVNLELSDHIVDLVSLGADLAVRSGPLPDSSLRARKLGMTEFKFVASPNYLKSAPALNGVEDLSNHHLIDFTFRRASSVWAFEAPDGLHEVRGAGLVRASDGEAIRDLALAGCGIARVASFQVGSDLAAGRLVEVLEAPVTSPADTEDIHAVYLGDRESIPARTRAFIDYLAAAAPKRLLELEEGAGHA